MFNKDRKDRDRGKKPARLRSILIRYLIPGLFLFTLLQIVVIYQTSSHFLKRHLINDSRILAKSIAGEVESFLGSTQVLSRIIAEHISAFSEEQENREKIIRAVVIHNPYIERLTLYDKRGSVLFTYPYNSDLVGSNFSGSSFFLAIQQGDLEFWSNSFISPASLRPTVTRSHSIPIDGSILSFNLDLSALSETLKQLESEGEYRLLLLDRDGITIAAGDTTLVEQRWRPGKLFQAERERINLEGNSFLSKPFTIESTGWRLQVLTPFDTLTQTTRNIALSMILPTLFILPLLILLVFRMSSYIEKPFIELAKEAEAIGEGNYHISWGETFWEAQVLIDTMHSMSLRIEKREEALQKSEQKYRLLVENAATAIFRWDKRGRIRFYNEYAANIFELPKQEMLRDLLVEQLSPADDPISFQEIWDNPETFSTYLNKNRRTDGKEIWIQWSTKPIRDKEGNLQEILSVGSDVSLLQETVKEKETLLMEVHHRVKNNLQLIISLLNLKKQELQGEDDQIAFQESINHIYSISLAHEHLYRESSFTSIDPDSYIQSLVSHLLENIPSGPLPVHFSISSEDISFSLEEAISCGLIISELVSNSLRHGFSASPSSAGDLPSSAGEEKRKELGIIIRRGEEREDVFIEISDNGTGFDPALFEKADTLGFQLIKILAAQLKGEISYYRDGGSHFILRLPVTPGTPERPLKRNP